MLKYVSRNVDVLARLYVCTEVCEVISKILCAGVVEVISKLLIFPQHLCLNVNMDV